MAGLLTPPQEAILALTAREWAASPCDAYPCGLEVWRYVNAFSGRPAEPLPDHTTRKAMVALLQREGGLEQYARGLMLSIGWIEVERPVRGDVAIIDIPGQGITCAICLGGRFMAKGSRLVVTIPATPLAAWSLTQCPKPSQSHSSPR